MPDFIMARREIPSENKFDVVAIDPDEQDERILRDIAADYPKNIYFFANLTEDI